MAKTLTKDDIKTLVEKHGRKPDSLLAVLLDIQEKSGNNFVSEEWAQTVAGEMDVPLAKINDVLTFYAMFSTEPKGKYVVELCKSAACHITGAQKLAKIFEDVLGIKVGGTTADGVFTLEYSPCFGACDIAPAVKIGDNVYGNLDRAKVVELLGFYREGKVCRNN
jgi:NADH-quinone oxidoreductase subunit E